MVSFSTKRLEQPLQDVAQINPNTGISDDYLNQYSSIHGQLQLCAMMIGDGKQEKAAEIGSRIRRRLANVPSYSTYARDELIPKVGTLVKGKPNPLHESDLLNDGTSGRVHELDAIARRLRRTVERKPKFDLDEVLDALHDGYQAMHGEKFADEKIDPLKRDVEPAQDALEEVLTAA